MNRPRLATKRVSCYFVLLGFVIGMLAAGVVVPLGFGSPIAETGLSASRLNDSDSRLGTDLRESGDFDRGTRTMGSPLPGSGSDLAGSQAARSDRLDSAGAPSSATTFRATDRGVTAKDIKVGILIGDTTGGAALGLNLASFSADLEERAWKALIAKVNSRGGILGRRVRPIIRRHNGLNEGETEARCNELIQDHKVFAVLAANFLDGTSMLCVTKQHRTPLFKGGTEAGDDIFSASAGYLSTIYSSHTRAARNLAWELHRMGRIKGKKIGVIGNEGFRIEAEALITTLRSSGYSITHASWLSEDLNTAQSQIPAEVQQMKRKGVQAVFMLSHFVDHTGFVQQAESQQFFPLYAVTDVFGSAGDVTTQGMPSSFDGAIAITQWRSSEWRYGYKEPAIDRACRDVYERGANEQLPRSGEDNYLTVMWVCDVVYRFEDAAKLAGVNLTRDGISAAVQRLGNRRLHFSGDGSYAQSKFDGADYLRSKQWSFECKCYVIVSDFRRGRF